MTLGSSGSARVVVCCMRENTLMIFLAAASSPGRMPPAGEMPTTLRARPRLASSSASAPPSELPARCAVPTPSASRCSSRKSAARAMLCGSSWAGSSVPPSWPCSVGAITSKRGTSSPSTGSQQRHVAVKPWIRTSGSPSPARYRAGEISGIVGGSYAFSGRGAPVALVLGARDAQRGGAEQGDQPRQQHEDGHAERQDVAVLATDDDPGGLRE